MGYAVEYVKVPGNPRLGPIEVNDVKMTRPFADPAPRRVDRVRVVGGLPRVIALREAHGLAAADVDGRVEDQAVAGALAQIPAKFESRRKPAALDFSGWNWTP